MKTGFEVDVISPSFKYTLALYKGGLFLLPPGSQLDVAGRYFVVDYPGYSPHAEEAYVRCQPQVMTDEEAVDLLRVAKEEGWKKIEDVD